MPHLTLVEKGSEKSHRVEGTEVLIGRDPSCAIFLEGDQAKTVSGRHARLFFHDARWYVEDAGSRNGTYVGQRKLDPGARHPVAVGDVIGLGVTGTQLTVREAVGARLAATMAEGPSLPRPAGPGKGSAARQSDDSGKVARVILRSESSGAQSLGQAERVTIGRALECIIRVEGEAATSVSRVHAEVFILNGQLSLRDGGSRHGTYLNGKKIGDPIALRQGDAIMLGPGGPSFILDEASIVTATRGGATVSPSASPAEREAPVGPTGTRGAKGAHKEAPAARDAQPGFSYQPTPALGQPSFTKSTPDRDQPVATAPNQPALRKTRMRSAPAMTESSGRSRALWAGVGVALVVVVALVLWAF